MDRPPVISPSMTNPATSPRLMEDYRKQENAWLLKCQMFPEPSPQRRIAAIGLTCSILIQGENLHDDQRYAIQNCIDTASDLFLSFQS